MLTVLEGDIGIASDQAAEFLHQAQTFPIVDGDPEVELDREHRPVAAGKERSAPFPGLDVEAVIGQPEIAVQDLVECVSEVEFLFRGQYDLLHNACPLHFQIQRRDCPEVRTEATMNAMDEPLFLQGLRATLAQALDELGLDGAFELRVAGASLFATFDLRCGDGEERDSRPDTTALMQVLRQFGRRKKLVLTSDETPAERGIRLAIGFTPEVNLHDSNDLDTIETVVNDLIRTFEKELKTRQTRRKRKDLPDPTRPADAYVNRKKSTRVAVRVELEPEDAEYLTAFNEASGMTKRQAIEEGLRLLYAARGFTPPSDDEPSPR